MSDSRPWRVRVLCTNPDSTRADLWAGVVIGGLFGLAGILALSSASEGPVFVLLGSVMLVFSLSKLVHDGRLLHRSAPAD